MNLELQDVLADVDTPDTSGDEHEDPETPLLHPPNTARALQLLQGMLSVTPTCVTEDSPYAQLYRQHQYQKKVQKKVKQMKKNARNCNFEDIYNDNGFWLQYERILDTYKNDGGRNFLNYLVALHCHLANESESESESEQSDEEPPAKKLKFEKKDDDDDDDDDNGHKSASGINNRVLPQSIRV